MAASRSRAVSSNHIIRGALIDETWAVFRVWDFSHSRTDNLRRVCEENILGAASSQWAQKVTWMLSRRFDPTGRDRPLVELARAGCDREIWKPLRLWHLTRDEFLLRDFLVNWLYPQFKQGACRLHTGDVIPYLKALGKKKDIEWSGTWTESTMIHVARGLLKMATDFGLLTGIQRKEFTSCHLPEQSLLYLLHAVAETAPNARRLIDSEEWRLFLMDSSDVERELLRLHQFRKLHYEVAGSLAQLKLPCDSTAAYTRMLGS